jgi:HEAT repeat protein
MIEAIANALRQLQSEHVEDVHDAMETLRAAADDAHDIVLDDLANHCGNQPNLARLLGEWGRPASVPVLVDAVGRGGASLRYAAVMALAAHVDPAALTALTGLARDADPDIAHLARIALDEVS